MKWSTCSVSKYKSGDRLGDDVALLIPDSCAAVFDGASRPELSPVTGITGGRAAASAAARGLSLLMTEDTSALSGARHHDEVERHHR